MAVRNYTLPLVTPAVFPTLVAQAPPEHLLRVALRNTPPVLGAFNPVVVFATDLNSLLRLPQEGFRIGLITARFPETLVLAPQEKLFAMNLSTAILPAQINVQDTGGSRVLGKMQPTQLRTWTIPNTGPIVLATARRVPLRIVLRSQAGTTFVATDPNELTQTALPGGNTFALGNGLVGDVFLLAPKQSLYALSSVALGSCSVAVSEAVPGT